MSTTEIQKKERKTTILGINKAPKETTIADIVSSYNVSELILVKKFVSRHFGTANFLLEFLTPEACEAAKEKHSTLIINGVELIPFFAPSDALQGHKTIVSENKLYVKYPSSVSVEKVKEKLAGLKVIEPQEGSFLFVSCKDADEQMKIKQKLDGATIDGKQITVTFAINKIRKHKNKRPTNSKTN